MPGRGSTLTDRGYIIVPHSHSGVCSSQAAKLGAWNLFCRGSRRWRWGFKMGSDFLRVPHLPGLRPSGPAPDQAISAWPHEPPALRALCCWLRRRLGPSSDLGAAVHVCVWSGPDRAGRLPRADSPSLQLTASFGSGFFPELGVLFLPSLTTHVFPGPEPPPTYTPYRTFNCWSTLGGEGRVPTPWGCPHILTWA